MGRFNDSISHPIGVVAKHKQMQLVVCDTEKKWFGCDTSSGFLPGDLEI